MKYSKLFLSILALISCLTSAQAAAKGGMDGGGGNSVVCRNEKGKILSAQLLDLYEGEHEFGLTYNNNPHMDIKMFLQGAVEKFKNVTRGREDNKLGFLSHPYWYYTDGRAWKLVSIMNYLERFDEIFKVLPVDVGLAPLNDSYEIVLPKNCKVERLALFKNSPGKILLDGEIWQNLDARNKAALIFHEASYNYEQKMSKATDSRTTRKIVAQSFSDQNTPGLFDGLEGHSNFCHRSFTDSEIDWTEIIYSNDSEGNHYFTFGSFLGKRLHSQTRIKFFKNPSKNEYGNAEVINSDIELPLMKLVKSDGYYSVNGKKYIRSSQDSKKIVLWIHGEGSSHKPMGFELTDNNGKAQCQAPIGMPAVTNILLEE